MVGIIMNTAENNNVLVNSVDSDAIVVFRTTLNSSETEIDSIAYLYS